MGQNLNDESRIAILQRKALGIMNFQSRDFHQGPLFKSNNILKLEDQTLIQNILLINNSFINLLPPIFNGWFTFCSDVHNYQLSNSFIFLIYLNHHITFVLTEKIQPL